MEHIVKEALQIYRINQSSIKLPEQQQTEQSQDQNHQMHPYCQCLQQIQSFKEKADRHKNKFAQFIFERKEELIIFQPVLQIEKKETIATQESQYQQLCKEKFKLEQIIKLCPPSQYHPSSLVVDEIISQCYRLLIKNRRQFEQHFFDFQKKQVNKSAIDFVKLRLIKDIQDSRNQTIIDQLNSMDEDQILNFQSKIHKERLEFRLKSRCLTEFMQKNESIAQTEELKEVMKIFEEITQTVVQEIQKLTAQRRLKESVMTFGQK